MRTLLPLFLLAWSSWAQDNLESVREEYKDLIPIITEIWKTPNGSVPTTNAPPVPGAPIWQTTNFAGCICVPYYNCDADTNTIDTSGKTDGFGVIDIRFGQGQGESAKKCEHYLDVCCNPAPESSGQPGGPTTPGGFEPTPGGFEPTTPATRPTVPPTGPPVTPPPPLEGPVKCGIRNPKGVDFQITGNTNHESEFAEFPWMVALVRKDYDYSAHNQENNLALCGGSLIHEQVVLTGAHCVEKYRPEELQIRAGEWDTQTARERYPYQQRDVRQIVLHDAFNSKTVYNDIALLVLREPVRWAANVKPVCLPRQGEVFRQQECYVTGWGKTSFGKVGQLSVILKKIDVPIVNRRKCETDLRKTRLGQRFNLHESFICAGGEAGKDACTGDGGGPLVCPDGPNSPRYEQAGIVAWGIGCGQANVPGVYADVARQRHWIDSHMKNLGFSTASYTV